MVAVCVFTWILYCVSVSVCLKFVPQPSAQDLFCIESDTQSFVDWRRNKFNYQLDQTDKSFFVVICSEQHLPIRRRKNVLLSPRVELICIDLAPITAHFMNSFSHLQKIIHLNVDQVYSVSNYCVEPKPIKKKSKYTINCVITQCFLHIRNQ